jgi:hypothetical protein
LLNSSQTARIWAAASYPALRGGELYSLIFAWQAISLNTITTVNLTSQQQYLLQRRPRIIGARRSVSTRYSKNFKYGSKREQIEEFSTRHYLRHSLNRSLNMQLNNGVRQPSNNTANTKYNAGCQ